MAKKLKAKPSKGAEVKAIRLLTQVSDHIAELADQVETPADTQRFAAELLRYAEKLTPWADKKAIEIVREVDRRNRQEWSGYMNAASRFSRTLKKNVLDGGRIATVVRDMQREAAGLIKSLPLDAAKRATKLATEYYTGGFRPSELVDKIRESGHVSKSRARLIARTEVSRAGASLTIARAAEAKSPGFIWRSSHDGRVRESHLELDGQYFDWDNLPNVDGYVIAPGQIFNCRCYAEIVFDRKEN